MSIVIEGRPDGLGNRIEELIVMEAYCQKYNDNGVYIWRNKPQYFKGKLIPRSYDIYLKLVNVEITDESESSIQFSEINIINKDFCQEEFLNAAQNIKPTFNIHFENGVKPLGIHLRGTDRINKEMKHPHFMKSEKQFEDFINRTILYINKISPAHLFICSDDMKYKEKILNQINQNIKVIDPIVNEDIPLEYIDFFALSMCSEVVMCSKFSTFAITASMIGNIKLTAFNNDLEVNERYKALFNYELKSLKQKIVDIFRFLN